jgi:adenylylsulfate kinase
VVWLTGLSGSGKTTISCALERALFDLGLQVYILDGDNIRHGLNAKLGFSREDREENIRRVAEVATLIADIGVVAIAAFISPYREDRRRAREIAQAAGKEFIEVYLDAPVEVCEQRDVKGLYKRARAGEIAEFTGISAPYEEPLAAEVVIDTDRASVSAAVAQLLAFLRPRLRLTTDEE